jgi:hypothetical protein
MIPKTLRMHALPLLRDLRAGGFFYIEIWNTYPPGTSPVANQIRCVAPLQGTTMIA